MTKKVSVTGLANIGKLLDRGDLPVTAVKRNDPKTQLAIVQRTVARLNGVREDVKFKLVEAAVREAYNLGHADMMAQSEAVEVLLNKQYETRTKLTMPTVIAAVMEQIGMSSMMLDLEAVATVFERTRIEFEAQVGEAGEFIEYRLIHLADNKQVSA